MATHFGTLAQKIPWTEKPGVHGFAKSWTQLSDLTFYVLNVVNSDTVNIGWTLKWVSIMVFSRYMSRSRISGSLVVLFLCPPTVLESSLFSTPSLVSTFYRFFDDGHSDWCEVITHCSWFAFFWLWASFHVLLGHLYVSFGLFVSLILSFMSCSYILEINPLLVASFPNMLCHSDTCFLSNAMR